MSAGREFSLSTGAAAVLAMPPADDLVQTGRRLPAGVHLGTSSWNFPGWQGLVWAPGSSLRGLTDRGLPAYSAFPVFRTAGIDQGYWRPLSAQQYRRYAGQVPENFRFLVKAPARITDWALRGPRGEPRGRSPDYCNGARAVDEFVGPVLEGLGDKAGPLVFVFPALGRDLIRDPQERIRELERIVEFLSELPKTYRGLTPVYAAEMRTRAIFTPRWIRGLRSAPARMVVGLHPSLPSVMRQTDALRLLDDPDCETEDWKLRGDLVIRWSLASGEKFPHLQELWRPYGRLQRPDAVTREGIAMLLEKAVRCGVRSFAVANNKAEGCAPLTMAAVARRLEERLRGARLAESARRGTQTPF